MIKFPLLPRSGQIFLARLVVNQVDDDVPHDRTPLFDPRVSIPGDCFRVSSRAKENGFVGTTELFRRPRKSETASRDRERQSSSLVTRIRESCLSDNDARRGLVAGRAGRLP